MNITGWYYPNELAKRLELDLSHIYVYCSFDKEGN